MLYDVVRRMLPPDSRNSQAVDDEPVIWDPRETEKPSIGLALGGGAARGWSHIGALKALNEADIRPDIIAGTSIGAVVGGCYAANHLDMLEDFARSLTGRRIIGLLDFNIRGGGLIGGSKLKSLLEDQLKNIAIESLSRKFICVATELGTGHEIWLRRGQLVEAMRASYALPGIFEPVPLGKRWLVDGALVNPVPVSVCRALGARLVIAVNLNMDTFGHGSVLQDLEVGQSEEPEVKTSFLESLGQTKRSIKRQLLGASGQGPGLSSVMMESFNIIQDRIARSRLAGDPPDIMIGPRVGDIGLFEFQKAEQAIEAGYTATVRHIDEIRDMTRALA
ncbi:patatin-like phospholipase family protein [Coralliovum pocilloporae]|uniref:patatin-like phospholipase family protein n=1 Tax=Coralliovum pocilloporae TaxID=3066369 RepID=UPI003306AB8B